MTEQGEGQIDEELASAGVNQGIPEQQKAEEQQCKRLHRNTEHRNSRRRHPERFGRRLRGLWRC